MIVFLEKIIRHIQRLGLYNLANRLDIINIRIMTYYARNEKLIAMIGDKSHKLLQEASGQDLGNNRFALECFLKEAEERKLENSVTKWAREIAANDSLSGLVCAQKKLKVSIEPVDQEKATQAEMFLSLARQRQSIRYYTTDNVSKETVSLLLNCAIEAPSSCNRQSWRFYIVREKKKKQYLANLRGVSFIEQAPIVVIVMIDSSLYNNRAEALTTGIMDASAAIMNILYACTANGLGACWVNFISSVGKKGSRKLLRRLGLDDNLIVIALVTVGWPKRITPKPGRREATAHLA